MVILSERLADKSQDFRLSLLSYIARFKRLARNGLQVPLGTVFEECTIPSHQDKSIFAGRGDENPIDRIPRRVAREEG
jgi:hypothetical protein